MTARPHIHHDIRTADITYFERMIFDRQPEERNWYFGPGVTITYDPEHNALLFMELFKKSGRFLRNYTPQQLEHGCWAIFGHGFDGGLYELIWQDALPIAQKEHLIMSMFDIYGGLFSLNPLKNACEMWWDSLAYNFNPMKTALPESNQEHRRIQDAMFITLERILQLPSIPCQSAALHGLNHVQHPDTAELIKDFIRTNPELTPDEIDYAMCCAAGQAL